MQRDTAGRVAAASAVLLLVAVAVVWWALDRPSEQPGSSPASPPSSEPSVTRPSAAPSPGAEGRPVARCAGPYRAGRVSRTYWGMHVSTPLSDDLPDAPIGAVNFTTSQVYWNQVETAPGRYDFARLDDLVAAAAARHARPLLVLGFTPTFHAEDPTSATARTTPPDATAWRSWVVAVVERYGDRLDYEVWPEPNIVGNWSGTPGQMAGLTVTAGDIIHDRAPGALVVAPATALRLPAQRAWMDRFWATEVAGAPVAGSVDAVAIDPFPVEAGTPEDALDLICRARDVLARHGVGLPVWTNEINYGVPGGGGADDVRHYPDDRQAAAVARTYLLQGAIGVERVYWLGWGSYRGLAVELEREGATTPAGVAYRVVHGWLAGSTRPRCVVDGGLYTCTVARDQQELRILWRVRGETGVPTGPGAMWVEDLAGARRQLSGSGTVRVGQSPLAVVAPGSS